MINYDINTIKNQIIQVTSTNIDTKKVKVFVDDNVYIPIYKTEYYKYFKEDKIEWSEFEKLHTNIINRGKKRVYYLLAKRQYTVYEIRTKLTRGHYNTSDIETILKYFIDLGYLDDYKFASNYIDYYKDKKSILQIKQKLSSKGISREIISELLEDTDELNTLQYNLAYDLAIKKYNRLKGDNKRQKLYNYLASKGYGYNIISGIVSEVIFEYKDYN